MRPFMLEARLGTPMIQEPDAYLTLDSVLAAAIYQKTGDVEMAHGAIPLQKIGGLWCGSAAFLIDPRYQAQKFIASLRQHFGDYDDDARKKVLRVGGPDKPDLDARQSAQADRIVWFGVGDPERCRELIASLGGIGKKVAQGYGEILGASVIDLTLDRAAVLPDGTPARPIPVSAWARIRAKNDALQSVGALPVDIVGMRPAYWANENKAMCVLPRMRRLSENQLLRIQEGAMATLPNEPMTEKPGAISGSVFFAEQVGRKLAAAEGLPGNTDKTADQCAACGSRDRLQRAGSGYTTLCGDCFTFGGTYAHIRRPGRMGAGWMGLVAPGATRLVTSVEYKAKEARPFISVPGVDIEYGKAAVSRFLRDALLNPPEPPYLLFVSGNASVNILRNLAVTWSNRRVHISGNAPAIVDAIRLGENFQAWKDSGIRATIVNQAMFWRTRLHEAYNKNTRESMDYGLQKIMKKHDCEALLKRLPPQYSDDYAYLLRLMNLEEKLERSAKK